MSYEFNPESPVFEFQNPYKVENLALIASGAVTLVAGVSIMLAARGSIAQGQGGRAMVTVGIAVLLLLFGIGLLAKAFTQLRYFFGRNRPESLAPLVAPDRDGNSPLADNLKETLRQNAITFREPTGALNGLLYSWLPHLIFAPAVLQRNAQDLFHKCLALAATLCSFLICWLMFGQSASSGWIGLAYAAAAAPQILRPLIDHGGAGSAADAPEVGARGLIVLFVLALLGPVILALGAPHLPSLGTLSINAALAFALLCALAGCVAFGLALKNQLQQAPQAVGAARVTETVTMNAHPNKLLEELDRILMERWYSRIPNRRYTRRSPAVSGQQGQFAMDIFEESQPRPHSNRTATGVGHALATPQFRWLAVLTAMAMCYLTLGAIAAVLVARGLLAGEVVSTVAAVALSQIAVGTFCFRAAHVLWGRFDFISELIWVDVSGSFESARVNLGNQLSGNVQTSKNVINIESMTMRVWVSEIDTVIFGKNARRQVTGMRGMQRTADDIAAALKGFGEARSMVVAPTSSLDFERAQKVGAMHQLVGAGGAQAAGGAPTQLNTAAGVMAAMSGPADGVAPAALSCSGCDTPLDADTRFCGECGRPV